MGSTSTGVSGYGPFEFMDQSGKHVSIPLTALTLNNGVITSTDPNWNKVLSNPPAQALYQYMLNVTPPLLWPTPAPAPFPAMVVRAVNAGTAGNNITVNVTVTPAASSPPIQDPTTQTFTLTVTESDTYANQTPATIANTLKTAGALVYVVQTVQTTGVPESYSGTLTGSPDQVPIEGSGSPGTLFVLSPRQNTLGASAGAQYTQLTITPNLASPSNPNAGTFNLQATWTYTVSCTLDSLASVSSELGYVITIGKPSSGAFSIPAQTSTTLSGGTANSNASGILYTGITSL
jgi:hypothetical protein